MPWPSKIAIDFGGGAGAGDGDRIYSAFQQVETKFNAIVDTGLASSATTIAGTDTTQPVHSAGVAAAIADAVDRGALVVGLATAVASRNIPAVAQRIATLGYSAVGAGAAVYERDTVAGSGGLTSADGAKWRLVGPVVDAATLGVVGDGVVDDRAALSAFNTLGYGARLSKPASKNTLSSPLDIRVPVAADPSATWASLTDTGKLTWTSEKGAWTNVGVVNTRRANIHRLADRVFIGGAADQFAGDSAAADGGTSWWSSAANGASYLGVNATLLTIARHTPYGIVSLVRGSDVHGNTPIGLGVSVVNDVATKPAWGAIIEAQRESGATMYCMEFGAKDKGTVFTTLNAYNNGAGVFGLWMAGGGDANFGGAATRPANSAIVVLKNAASGLSGGGWATGIVFKSDALDGTDGSAGSSGSATAVSMARRHCIDWGAPTVGALPTGSFGARISSSVVDANNAVQVLFSDSTMDIATRSGASFLNVTNGGVDYVSLRSSTGQARIDGLGASANVDIYFVPKGTGSVKFGTYVATALAISGYIQIKDAGGTLRKLAVVT